MGIPTGKSAVRSNKGKPTWLTLAQISVGVQHFLDFRGVFGHGQSEHQQDSSFGRAEVVTQQPQVSWVFRDIAHSVHG